MAPGHHRSQGRIVDRLRGRVQTLGAAGHRSALAVHAALVAFAQKRVPRRTHVGGAQNVPVCPAGFRVHVRVRQPAGEQSQRENGKRQSHLCFFGFSIILF